MTCLRLSEMGGIDTALKPAGILLDQERQPGMGPQPTQESFGGRGEGGQWSSGLFPPTAPVTFWALLFRDNRQPPPHVTLPCLHTVALLQEDNEYLLGFIIRAHICQADNLELQWSEIAFGSASVTGGLWLLGNLILVCALLWE